MECFSPTSRLRERLRSSQMPCGSAARERALDRLLAPRVLKGASFCAVVATAQLAMIAPHEFKEPQAVVSNNSRPFLQAS